MTTNCGERLIEEAAKIAAKAGMGSQLYDSVLVNTIRRMSSDDIRSAISRLIVEDDDD